MRREWVVGDCWLYCERVGVRVLWLGPVVEDGDFAPLYGCAECVDRLRAKLWRYRTAQDLAPAR